jgi:hypothetical protein
MEEIIEGFEKIVEGFENKRVEAFTHFTNIKKLEIFDDEECIKFFDILIECNLIEKILIDAILKKNNGLIDILIEKITKKMLDILEICNDWVSNEDNFINEECYLLICEYSKLNHIKLTKLCNFAKMINQNSSSSSNTR